MFKLTIILLLFITTTPTTPCFADQCYYAQIINPNTYLYRDYDKTAIFELPQTYFVYISGYQKGCYTASYNGIKGYVKSSEVKVVKEIPKNPYLNTSTFRLFASDYNTLKTRPLSLAQDITTLPINTPINYIGKINGTELISGRGNTWYYCSYFIDRQYTGYVYAGLCDSLNIVYNTEVVSYISNPYSSPSLEYIEYLNSPLGKKLVIIPIILISIIFFSLMFVPYFIKKRKTKPSSIYFIEDGKL
jgi:hypothetical protein